MDGEPSTSRKRNLDNINGGSSKYISQSSVEKEETDESKKQKLIINSDVSSIMPNHDDKNTEADEDGDEEITDDEESTENEIEVDKKSAFNGKIETYKIDLYSIFEADADIGHVFDRLNDKFVTILSGFRNMHWRVKVLFTLHGCLAEYEYVDFKLTVEKILDDVEQIDECLQNIRSSIQSKFEVYSRENVGIKQFQHIFLHIYEFDNSNINVRVPMEVSHAVVSIPAADDSSFKWAVLSGLHPEIDTPHRGNLKRFSDELVLGDIEGPVMLQDVPLIEQINDISFNIFMLKYSFVSKKKEIEGPVYHTKVRKSRHVNLLQLTEHDSIYYCYIKNLKSLLDPNGDEGDSVICDGCLTFFTQSNLNNHIDNCPRIKITFPKENKLRFVDSGYGKLLPFVVYADFEALLSPIREENNKKLRKSNKQSDYKVENVRKHEAYAYSYFIKGLTEEFCQLRNGRAENTLDCVNEFEENLMNDLKRLLSAYMRSNRNSTVQTVPVFIHAFQNYDSNFLVYADNSIDFVLGKNHSYISLSKKIANSEFGTFSIRYTDSYKFLEESLETLVSDLEPEKFIEIRRLIHDEYGLHLMRRKGVVPFDAIQSLEDLQQTALPGKQMFYDTLKDAEITDDQYTHAQNVWNYFNCVNLGDYIDVYVQSDVLLLADVFENFRNFYMEKYELDPAYYYSLSKLSWDAMLKITDVQLDIMTDLDMISFVRKGIRGGISHCCKRHATASNKFIPETIDNETKSYIMYYDANNLYGHAMSQYLPYGGFEWVDVKVNYDLPDDSPIGYILEVDIEYPENLHDLHSDLPFCSEKKNTGGDVEKLMTDFLPKTNYIIHHAHLVLCRKHGLIVRKIHRVLKFNQKPWLKPYIDYNTEQRMRSTSEPHIRFFKFLNNTIYGKSIENTEKYRNVKFVNKWYGAISYITRPDHEEHIIINNETVAIQQKKTKITYKNPFYLGFSILELSKVHMYKFHYEVMKKEFVDNIKLLYTDTDSFVYQIFTEDYYEKVKKLLKDNFDTSNYELNNIFGIPLVNRKVNGYFKDEMKGRVVKEFVCLRPKVYMIDAGEIVIKKASGTLKEVTKKFNIDDYKNCLFNKTPLVREFYRIRGVDGILYTQKVSKKVLSPDDDKRYILSNNIDTLPFGHYLISSITS